ncbi:MAG: hypothetical protein L6244_04780 [Candidatus Methanoperedenaceae archaeon]|nr:hypothetical protein [Candidatus Methanoperedenaceae archaeon]
MNMVETIKAGESETIEFKTSLFGIPLATGISLTLIDHFVRASITLIFGMISTIHIGFASRAYFAERKRSALKADDFVSKT